MAKGKGKGAGRPPKYETVKALQEAIASYFEGNLTHPTITGLVLHLGFADRHSFYAYENIKKFSHTIKRSRTMIENFYETELMGDSRSGAIFALKNFGWSDKQEIEHSGQILEIRETVVSPKY